VKAPSVYTECPFRAKEEFCTSIVDLSEASPGQILVYGCCLWLCEIWALVVHQWFSGSFFELSVTLFSN
jgi:hypothetical protein